MIEMLAVSSALGVLAAAPLPPIERRVAVMGTTLKVEVSGLDRPSALTLAERLIRAVADAEARLSTWRDESELQTLNHAAVGDSVPLSRPTWEALDRAFAWCRASEGTFDPTVAPLVRAWGLRSGGRQPLPEEIRAALARTGAQGIELTRAPLGARKYVEREIEEGGFGKGAALDEALALVGTDPSSAGARLVRLDLGGQLAWKGAEEPVVVELADPRDRARPVAAIELDDTAGSVSTSGNSERGVVTAAGQSIGHLLDPRSGYPAPDFGSVAVFAPSALDADCLSTALFVMGPERGRRFLSERGGGFEAVFLVVEGERLRALGTPGLALRVRALVPDLHIETTGGSR